MIIVSTWSFEYALQLKSMKTVCFCCVRHPMRILMLSAIPKSIFIRTFKLIRTMLKSLHVLLGLSLILNPYQQGSYTKGATKHLIIAYDENKDKIGKEIVSEYHSVY